MFSEPSLKPPSQLRQAVAAAVRQLQHVSPQVGGFFGGLVEFGPYDIDFGGWFGIFLGGFRKRNGPKNHVKILWEEQTPQELRTLENFSSSPRCGHRMVRRFFRQVKRSALSVVGQVGIRSNRLVGCSRIMSGGGPWWWRRSL